MSDVGGQVVGQQYLSDIHPIGNDSGIDAEKIIAGGVTEMDHASLAQEVAHKVAGLNGQGFFALAFAANFRGLHGLETNGHSLAEQRMNTRNGHGASVAVITGMIDDVVEIKAGQRGGGQEKDKSQQK